MWGACKLPAAVLTAHAAAVVASGRAPVLVPALSGRFCSCQHPSFLARSPARFTCSAISFPHNVATNCVLQSTHQHMRASTQIASRVVLLTGCPRYLLPA